jgi:hypothetical protein
MEAPQSLRHGRLFDSDLDWAFFSSLVAADLTGRVKSDQSKDGSMTGIAVGHLALGDLMRRM